MLSIANEHVLMSGLNGIHCNTVQEMAQTLYETLYTITTILTAQIERNGRRDNWSPTSLVDDIYLLMSLWKLIGLQIATDFVIVKFLIYLNICRIYLI